MLRLRYIRNPTCHYLLLMREQAKYLKPSMFYHWKMMMYLNQTSQKLQKYCIGYPLIKHAAEFIDEESRPINIADRQPRSQLVIIRENAWLQHLSYSYHVWPSTFAIRTSLLRKYKDVLFKLKLHADFAIFSLALLEGNILYVPERLTYYRIGSGHSQLTSCEKLPKLVCTWNKYSYDDFFLYKI